MCGREADQQGEVAVVVLDPEEAEMPRYRFPNECHCDPRNCPCPLPVNPHIGCNFNAGVGNRKPSPSPPPPADPNFQYYGNGNRKPSPSPPPPPPPGDPNYQFYGGNGPHRGSPPPPPPAPGDIPDRPNGNGSRRPTPPPPPPGDPNPQYYGGNSGGGPKPMPSPPPMNHPNFGPQDNQKPTFSPPPYPYDHPPPPPSRYPPRRSRPTRPHPISSGGGPSHLFALAATLFLFLIGLIALILYLIYRPSSPHFSLTSASIFLLNSSNPHATTTPTTCFIATTMQFTILAKNPSRKASLYYDNLVATLAYSNGQVIAPPAKLPPLHQGKRSTVAATIVVGDGGEAVPVAPGLIQAVVADVRNGVMGLRLVVEGRARYKLVDGLIKSGHYGFSVRCDLLVGVGAVVQRGAYGGQVPLVGDPKCTVSI